MKIFSNNFIQLCLNIGLLTSGLIVSSTVIAQSDFNFVPEKPGGDLPPLPEYPIAPKPQANIVLPPIPKDSNQYLATQESVTVKQIRLIGNTVFSDQQLRHITGYYEGRKITTDELQELRRRLTLYYIDQGYINSGAIINDQDILNGVIEISIIEGTLNETKISGNKRLRKSYVQSRLTLPDNKPLHLPELQEKIQLLHQDRLINRINAHLKPGIERGESILEVIVDERRPYEFGFSFNNRRSPSVGELRGELWASHLNISGYGDAITLQYGMTEGLDDIGLNYTLPLNRQDTRLGLSGSRSDSLIIEEPFDAINIKSKTENWGISLSHPFWRTLKGHFTSSLALDRRNSKTVFLEDEQPYPSVGSEDGETTVTVLRLNQEWVSRKSNRVLAIRSKVSFGLNALGATINKNSIADGKFTAWLGQLQWVQRISKHNIQLVARSDFQFTKDSLLPLEQFGIGGASSVRGYRENLMVRDKGWIGSVELRIPVANQKLQIAAFYDIGWGENVLKPRQELKDISSIGLGLRWNPNQYLHSQLYWGHALKNIDVGKEDSLQDSGFHFRFDVSF